MTIIEALQNGKIRYSRGKYFDAQTLPGDRLWADGPGALEQIRRDAAEKYVGSVFVTFTQQLPSAVPTNCPAHCWAEAVVINDKYVGALVTWSTEERKQNWRASRQRSDMPFDEFNVRRHGQGDD